MNLRTFPLPTIVIVLCVCSGHITSPAHAAGALDAPVERSSYWRERTSFFRTFPTTGTVAMIGDSLTDGAEWHEMFPDRNISNRGIDGDTTTGVLARLDDILSAKPEAAFVMIGINDFADEGRSVEAVFDNYRAIVSRLEENGVRVVIQSTLPCNEAKGAWKSCSSIIGKIRQLNVRLAGITSEKVTFVDLTPVLAGDGGLKDEFTYDGVHLNGEGYRRWKAAIAPFMPVGDNAPHPIQ